jgi:hypothetical protein
VWRSWRAFDFSILIRSGLVEHGDQGGAATMPLVQRRQVISERPALTGGVGGSACPFEDLDGAGLGRPAGCFQLGVDQSQIDRQCVTWVARFARLGQPQPPLTARIPFRKV